MSRDGLKACFWCLVDVLNFNKMWMCEESCVLYDDLWRLTRVRDEMCGGDGWPLKRVSGICEGLLRGDEAVTVRDDASTLEGCKCEDSKALWGGNKKTRRGGWQL